ncbi:MAG: hypothetical protein L0Z53_17180 [Acidobacteriales bacterium]|nr:hypothetical protein [Terriglobales bacterium]
MKRLLALSLVFSLVGCSGFVFVSNFPAGSVSSCTGFISIVQFGSVVHHGTSVSVTFVTFLQSGTATNLTFCGNVVNQFPLDAMVRVNFAQATPCSTVQTVVIL